MLHICRVTLEPSSVYKNHKLYAYWLYDFFINVQLFYFWWPNAHKPSVTLQFMTLPCNWRFNSWFDRQIWHSWMWSLTVTGVFFYFYCLTSGKLCMSKHSFSYVFIVPWNNIQKRLLLSIFHMQRRLWRVCTFAQADLSLRPGTEIPCAGLKTIYVQFIRTVNAVVRLHQQPWHIWATTSALYQCVKNAPSAL